MSPSPLLLSPALLSPAIYLPVYLQAVRAGLPSPADDYLDAPIDLSRTLIQKARERSRLLLELHALRRHEPADERRL